jgi:hypothetical protein
MSGEQVEKPFLLREKSTKPTQHLKCPYFAALTVLAGQTAPS